MTVPAREQARGETGTSRFDTFRDWLVLRSVCRRIDTARPVHLLDVGCGYRAPLLTRMRDRLASGTGIDLRVADAVKQQEGLTFLEESIESVLPGLRSGSFDLITLLSVVEHLDDPATALRECHRLLKPRGNLIVHVPTWRAKPVLEFLAFRLDIARYEIEDHKRYYSARDLWPLLVGADFRPSAIRLDSTHLGMTLLGVATKQPVL